MNIFYNANGAPVARSRGASSPVRDEFAAIEAGFDLVAPLASPAFTGTPTAPTPVSLADDSTKIATTAFVQDVLGAAGTLLPVQTTHAGKSLKTNGSVASWELTLASQTGNAGKFLKTNGTVDSWGDPIPIGGIIQAYAPPSGYLACDGSVYLQSAYPDLFTAIGHPPGYTTAAVRFSGLPDSPGAASGAAFSADGTLFALAITASPFVAIYKLDGDTFQRMAQPNTAPASTGQSVAFSDDGAYLAVGHDTTPFVSIYKRAGDQWVKLANPGTLPASGGTGVRFSSDGTYLAVSHGTTPYVTIYKRAGDVFTKLTNPVTLPAVGGIEVAFSPDFTYLAVASSSANYLTIYKRSGDVFTKLSDPGTLPAGAANGVSMSADYLAVSHTTTPFVTIYSRSGDVFTKMADPGTLPAGNATGVALSADQTYCFVGHNTTPFISIYKRAAAVWTKLTNPTDLPGAVPACMALGISDRVLAINMASGFETAFYRAYGYDTSTEFAVPIIDIESNDLNDRASATLTSYIRAT